jgi:hypothetical protein
MDNKNEKTNKSKINRVIISRNDINRYNQINEKNIEAHLRSVSPKSQFFIIKSINEDNIHKSIKYGIWSSTLKGNKKLNNSFLESVKTNNPVYLFFSVNCSGRFVGLAQMMTEYNNQSNFMHWSQEKWKGYFNLKWLIIKDIPNTSFKHLINQ